MNIAPLHGGYWLVFVRFRARGSLNSGLLRRDYTQSPSDWSSVLWGLNDSSTHRRDIRVLINARSCVYAAHKVRSGPNLNVRSTPCLWFLTHERILHTSHRSKQISHSCVKWLVTVVLCSSLGSHIGVYIVKLNIPKFCTYFDLFTTKYFRATSEVCMIAVLVLFLVRNWSISVG